MAEFLDCSIDTIKSIESGRMKLSESMAERMFHEFGISKAWLLAGDVSAPPIAQNREPYTEEHFHNAQADKGEYEKVNPFFLMGHLMNAHLRVARILLAANEQRRFHIALFKLREALEKVEAVFGLKPDDGIDLVAAKDLLEDGRRYFETIDGFTRPLMEQLSPKPEKPARSKRSVRRRKV